MTPPDQDYIRKAVELADGWRLSDDKEPLIYLDDGTSDGISFMSWSYPQFMLDTLAAQLVRQVDALGLHMDLYAMRSEVWDGPNVIKSSPFTDNRTMNTIKAIVDSKVLSTGYRVKNE